MGIDYDIRGNQKKGDRQTTTSNNYHQLLVKLYSFLARRTESKFNQVVLKRLNQSCVNRYPVSISKLAKLACNQKESNTMLVVVAPILNDERMLVVPKLRVCALKFTA